MSNSPQPAPAPSVLLEARHDGVATLVMNRPDRLNALDTKLVTTLNDALGRLAKDGSVRVVVLTGAGRAFCAGGDLALIGQVRTTGATRDLELLLASGTQAVLTMRSMPQPVIAAVNGAAAGAGMNLAKVGLFPDFGGTYFLPQLVGPAKSAELFYTGDMIDAKTALQLGIVNQVVPATGLAAEVNSLARKIAEGPPFPIRAVKKTLFASESEKLALALRQEVEEQIRCYLSQDCSEGISAFFEKRPPQFRGK